MKTSGGDRSWLTVAVLSWAQDKGMFQHLYPIVLCKGWTTSYISRSQSSRDKFFLFLIAQKLLFLLKYWLISVLRACDSWNLSYFFFVSIASKLQTRFRVHPSQKLYKSSFSFVCFVDLFQIWFYFMSLPLSLSSLSLTSIFILLFCILYRFLKKPP